MSIVDEKRCYDCFGVLADETRIRILSLLKNGESNVTDLSNEVGVTQPTVSYHLKMLGDLGLILKERRGREMYYIFNNDYPCKGCGVFSAPIRV